MCTSAAKKGELNIILPVSMTSFLLGLLCARWKFKSGRTEVIEIEPENVLKTPAEENMSIEIVGNNPEIMR